MAYEGFLSLAGNEIVNNARVAAYASHLVPQIAPSCGSCADLHLALGDEPYTSPALDRAAWFDPALPESAGFAGFFALSVSGIENDTRTASVYQGSFDGGAIGRVRRAVKEVRVTGLLFAVDDCSLEYGMEWLKNSLNGNPCTNPVSGCSGDDLCFYSCCPEVTVGAVDEDAEPQIHDVSLVAWDVTGGQWLSGRWTVSDTPQTATGPSLEPTCDEVTYRALIEPSEGLTARLRVVNTMGQTVASSGAVVLQRTNWARNPSFSTGTATFWTPGTNTTIDPGPSDPPDQAIVSADADVTSGETLATVEGAQADTGDVFSGRMTVRMDPEGVVWTNLVPNPAVRTLGGFNTSQGVVRDESVMFTDTGSARLDAETDGATEISSIAYGTDDDSYTIRIDDSQDYNLGVYVRVSSTADVGITLYWFDDTDSVIVTLSYPRVTVQPNQWQRVEVPANPPGGAVRLAFGVDAEAPTGQPFNANDSLWVDAMMVSPQEPLIGYFDGNSPDAFWQGLPHSSPSTLSPSGDSACVQLGIDLPDGSTVLSDPYTVTPAASTELVVSGATVGQDGQVTLSLVACGDITMGTALIVSRALLERSAEPGEYFDGSTPDTETYDYQWDGVPGLAPSSRTLDGPLTATTPGSQTELTPEIDALDGEVFNVTSVTAAYRPALSPEECAVTYERLLRNVTAIAGPTTLEEYAPCGGRMRRVEFALAAGVPWVWKIVEPEFEVTPGSDVVTVSSEGCAEPEPQPISDPECPLPPPPPRPPQVRTCVEEPPYYLRRTVAIPGDVISPSQQAVPVVTLDVESSTAVRNVRIRFYPDPLSRRDIDDLGECSWCGEFVVTYIPGSSSITLDGMTESAVVTMPGDEQRPASHLLRSSDGGPMVWPLLTCGLPYVMTVDVAPVSADVVTGDMQLAVRS